MVASNGFVRGSLLVAARRQLRSKGWATVVALVLALGVGANALLFCVIDAVWLRQIPYSDAHRIVLTVSQSQHQTVASSLQWCDISRLRSQFHIFDSAAAFESNRANSLEIDGRSVVVGSRSVEPTFFDVLREPPIHGRLFDLSSPPTVGPIPIVLTESFARAQFNGEDPVNSGRRIRFGGTPAIIIGVVSDRVRTVQMSDIFVPFSRPSCDDARGSSQRVYLLARLNSSQSVAGANAAMHAMIQTESNGQSRIGQPTFLAPLGDYIVGASVRRTLVGLAAGAILLLMAACANVASLLLADVYRRGQEIATRASLGARRHQLIQEVLLEASVHSIPATGLGLITVWGLLQWVIHLMPEIRGAQTIALDARALVFAFVLQILVLIAIVAAPFVAVYRLQPQEWLSGRPRRAPAASVRRGLAAMLFIQALVSTVVLSTASVISMRYARLIGTSPGFNPLQVVTIDGTAPNGRPFMGDSQLPNELQVLASLESMPGVVSAATTDQLPFSGTSAQYAVRPEGPQGNSQQSLVFYRRVSPRYFETMHIPLLRGRFFDDSDRKGDEATIIVTETAGSTLWRNEDPIGRYLFVGRQPLRVVGVVGDVRSVGLDHAPLPEVYRSRLQDPTGGATFVIRTTAADEHAVALALRDQNSARRLGMNIESIRTMNDWVDRTIRAPRFRLLLLSSFAILAAVITITGAAALSVRAVITRSQEIAIRLALGASYRGLVRKIVADTLLPIVLGVGAGVTALYGLQPITQRLLDTSEQLTLPSLVWPLLLFVLSATIGALCPALRIMRLMPSRVLRSANGE